MTALDAQNAETCLPERRDEFRSGDAERGSCGYGHSLDTDELQFLLGRALHLQAQRDSFADAVGDLIKRTRLCVTARDLGNGGYIIALCIALNHDVELAWHGMSSALL